MALKLWDPARALAGAHVRATWNRMRRESGAAGATSLVALAAVVLLVLALPALALFQLGSEIGETWSHDAAAPSRWASIQAILTLLFPLCGAARWKPAIEPKQLGTLPVSGGALLAAELPAAQVEVFPLLAAAGIVSSNLGLALASPRHAGLAALLVVQGLIAMLASTVAAGCAWRWIGARGLRAIAGLVVAAGAVLAVGFGGRAAVREVVSSAVAALPGSWLVAALGGAQESSSREGAPFVALAFAATGALLIVAARLRLNVRDPESPRPMARVKSLAARASRSPRGTIAGTALCHWLDARAGRTLLWMPLLVTLPLVVTLRAADWLGGDFELFGAAPAERARQAAELPLYAIVALAAVFVDGVIWLNPFGWFRRGVRSLLALPVSAEEQLSGLLLALATFAGAQTLLAALPLLAIRPPALDEIALGCGAGAFALAALGGIGQAIGMQLPRAVPREGSAELPFHLSWIPTAMILATAAASLVAYRLAWKVAPWLPGLVLPLVGIAALVAYRVVLPLLARELDRRRERLLTI